MNQNNTAATFGVAGDWHGNTQWVRKVLHDFAAENITHIYQVGDFGIWPGPQGKDFLVKTNQLAAELGITIHIIPGNHEDYNQIDLMDTDNDGWLYRKAYPQLKFAPRGHVWTYNGITMAALGGAGSIDRNLRVEGRDWWPQEEITDKDVRALIDNVTTQPWERLDILYTHEAPAGPRRVGITPRPAWITPEVEHYCWQQRILLREAVDATTPGWLFHGHWHDWYEDSIEGTTPDGTDYQTHIHGLAHDGSLQHAAVVTATPGTGIVDIRHLPIF